MRKAIVIWLIIILPALVFGQDSPNSQKRPLVFRNVTVIDMAGDRPQPNMTVIVSGNRILKAGKAVKIPKNAEVIQANGKFLIPGLWDMHVHIFNQISRRAPNTWYFPLFIAGGVTGVREMWTKPEDMNRVAEWRKQFSKNDLIAPRIVAAGTVVDGGQETTEVNVASAILGPTADTIEKPDEAAGFVRKLKAARVDFVKTYSSLSRETYFAIAREARKQNFPFAGHVPFTVRADEASEAGQKTMEHLNQILETCSTRQKELFQTPAAEWSSRHNKLMLDTFDEQKCRRLFKILAKNKTFQIPTLTRERMHHFTGDPVFFTDDTRLKYVPANTRKSWKSFDKGYAQISEAEKEIRNLHWKTIKQIIKEMNDAGVPFAAGTDVGNEYIYPGFSLHDELSLLVEAGLSPLEALRTATINPAKMLGKQNLFGTVEAGKIADLILLDANPLEDIGNTKKINSVVLNGRLFDRKALDKLAAEVENAAQNK